MLKLTIHFGCRYKQTKLQPNDFKCGINITAYVPVFQTGLGRAALPSRSKFQTVCVCNNHELIRPPISKWATSLKVKSWTLNPLNTEHYRGCSPISHNERSGRHLSVEGNSLLNCPA